MKVSCSSFSSSFDFVFIRDTVKWTKDWQIILVCFNEPTTKTASCHQNHNKLISSSITTRTLRFSNASLVKHSVFNNTGTTLVYTHSTLRQRRPLANPLILFFSLLSGVQRIQIKDPLSLEPPPLAPLSSSSSPSYHNLRQTRSVASRNMNASPGRFPCDRCGKVYRWYRNLTTHLRLECGKEPSIICPYCPRRTKHRNSMRSHIRRIHKILVWRKS